MRYGPKLSRQLDINAGKAVVLCEDHAQQIIWSYKKRKEPCGNPAKAIVDYGDRTMPVCGVHRRKAERKLQWLQSHAEDYAKAGIPVALYTIRELEASDA